MSNNNNSILLSFFQSLGINDVKIYQQHWQEVQRMSFPSVLRDILRKGIVEQGNYGPSLHIYGNDFHFYIGVSDYSRLEVNQEVDFSKLELIVLEKNGSKILRVCLEGEKRTDI